MVEISKRHKWWIAGVVTLGMFMVFLDDSIVNVALPQMQNDFNTNFGTVIWVNTAYFLTQAAVIPIVGYLSDRIGSKQVFLTALALFTTSSLLCALAPAKEALIAFRASQGIGGGALVTVGLAIAYRTFPLNERASASALISIPVVMAPSFGPTLGGYLSTSIHWNAIFMVNVPIGLLNLPLAFLVLLRDKPEQNGEMPGASKRLDIPGLLLSAVGFTALVYGITQIGSKGWGDQMVLISLLIGVVALVAFIVLELRISDPVLDLRLFKNYTFTTASFLTWLIIGVFCGSPFLLPLFFATVRGDTALVAGQFLIGQGVAIVVGMFISGGLYNRVGPRILVLFGLLFLAGGTYGLTQINTSTTGQELQVWLILVGLGLGFATPSLQVLALSVASNRDMGKASSLFNSTRQVALAVAVVTLTTYLTQQTATHTTEINNALQAGLTPRQLTGVAATCAQASGPAQNLTALENCVVKHAATTGMTDTFWVVLILSIVCTALALFIRRDLAIETLQQAKTPREETHLAGIPNVISTLAASGEEIMGPEILLWRHPKDDIMNGSLLTVGSSHFCILKSCGTILNIYEAGQHIVQAPDSSLFGSIQLAFNGEPISLQHEALYINRAKLLVRTSGVALSREMTEVGYSVDYYIHIATREGAVQFVQHMPYHSHTLTIQEISAYARPVIEQVVKQWLQVTPLEKVNKKWQDISYEVYRSLQKFLCNYGITLDEVRVQGLVDQLSCPVVCLGGRL